jgi:hypothetical protein
LLIGKTSHKNTTTTTTYLHGIRNFGFHVHPEQLKRPSLDGNRGIRGEIPRRRARSGGILPAPKAHLVSFVKSVIIEVPYIYTTSANAVINFYMGGKEGGRGGRGWEGRRERREREIESELNLNFIFANKNTRTRLVIAHGFSNRVKSHGTYYGHFIVYHLDTRHNARRVSFFKVSFSGRAHFYTGIKNIGSLARVCFFFNVLPIFLTLTVPWLSTNLITSFLRISNNIILYINNKSPYLGGRHTVLIVLQKLGNLLFGDKVLHRKDTGRVTELGHLDGAQVTARLDVLGEEAVGKRVVRILYKLG